MNKNYKNLFQNIGIFTLSNFATKFLSFLILPLYTYFLTTAEYGTIDLVTTLISLLFPVFSLSISDSVLRYAISNHENQKQIFSIGVKTIVLGYLPILVVSIVVFFFGNVGWTIISFAIIYILQAFNTLFGSFAKAINKTKEMAIITAITSISIVILNVLFVAKLGLGINGYWISTVIGNAIGVVLYVWICKLYNFYVRDRANKGLLKELLYYSVPLIPNALFWWLNSSLDRWALTLLSGVSVVGLYSCANRIPSILATINSIFSQAWNLSLFQSDSKQRYSFFVSTYNFYAELMMCCALGIIWLSKIIGSLMFSKDFFQAWIFIPLLTMGVFYSSLNAIIGSLFTSEKKTKYIFTTTMIGAIINGILNFVLVYIIGPNGAALSTLISYFVVWVMRVRTIKRNFRIVISIKKSFVHLALLSACTILMMMDSMFAVVTIITILYCTYFILCYGKKIKETIQTRHSKFPK